MIADAATDLAAWVADSVAPTPVHSGPPDHSVDDSATASICCYLLSISPRDGTRGLRRGPLYFDLTYLIAPSAADPIEALRLLDTLLGALADRADVELVSGPLDPQLWLALGVPPRPALALRTVARMDRPQSMAPPVRVPMILRTEGVRPLHGRLVSSTGISIASAEIHVAGIEAPVRTGSDGRFSFPAVSASEPPSTFEVYARGLRYEVAAEPALDASVPVVLVIDPIGVMP